jgi:hypothetical protein
MPIFPTLCVESRSRRHPVADPFADLDGFFWEVENIRWLLVLKGYFDETFDEHSGCTWVAGYVGDENAWRNYVRDWRNGLGERKQLHLSSLRWKKPSTRQLLADLAPIPSRSGLRGFVSGVRTSDFSDLVRGTKWEYHSNGYIVSLIDVTARALLSVPEGEHLEALFEERDQTQERAADGLFALSILPFFSDLKPQLLNRDGSKKLIKYGFQSKSDTILFDQADYLCYAVLQQHRNPGSQKALWTRPILDAGEITDGIMARETARQVFMEMMKNGRV